MGAQPGFFDFDHRMKRLSDLGDQLEAFVSAVAFEIFRGDLVLALAYSENGQGGRPPREWPDTGMAEDEEPRFSAQLIAMIHSSVEAFTFLEGHAAAPLGLKPHASKEKLVPAVSQAPEPTG